MSLEFVNRICPNCKNPNYMVALGDLSKAYKYKCMNCNTYFNNADVDAVYYDEKTVYEELQVRSLEKTAEFLFMFANDVIDDFANFRTPDIDRIREMLRTKVVR